MPLRGGMDAVDLIELRLGRNVFEKKRDQRGVVDLREVVKGLLEPFTVFRAEVGAARMPAINSFTLG